MSRTRLAIATFVALVAATARLGAQSVAPSDPAPLSVGPTFAAAALSPQLAEPSSAAPMLASSGGLTNGEKLMILGGVALITGAIIGDTPGTIIMIGGAAVGLYGLYLQLGRPHSGEPTKIGYAYTF